MTISVVITKLIAPFTWMKATTLVPECWNLLRVHCVAVRSLNFSKPSIPYIKKFCTHWCFTFESSNRSSSDFVFTLYSIFVTRCRTCFGALLVWCYDHIQLYKRELVYLLVFHRSVHVTMRAPLRSLWHWCAATYDKRLFYLFCF